MMSVAAAALGEPTDEPVILNTNLLPAPSS
jgi:hypothetical protein